MVMIDPKIVSHWLWQDAEKLKCWLDIQVLSVSNGSYEGKFVTSIQQLSNRWLVAKSVVSTFIKELVKEDIIRITELSEGKIIIEVPTSVDFKKQSNYYRDDDSDQTPIEREYRKRCDANPIWLEAMRKNHHLTETALSEELDNFLNFCICQGTNHQNFTDFKRHFNFWIAKRRYDRNEERQSSQYQKSWRPIEGEINYESSF